MAWTYGEDGERYPVEPGQIWRVGHHWFVCSDLMEPGQTFRKALTSGVLPEPTLVYSDPPWGQGLANGFRTKAGLGRADYLWTDLYRECADFAEQFDVPLWVESSVASSAIGKAVPEVISVLEHGTKTHRGYWGISYFGGNPSGLYYAYRSPAPAVELEGLAGFKVVAKVLSAYRPGVVLDPCSGLGGVPLEAQKAGWASVSNELAPHRVSKALSRVSLASGHEPERIA